ncbi:unnamed protein product [Cylicocyclus nassatus]|uniref:CBM21 domain-containing protein n=1 Tax=Cylicocyclus nassatus TaxID=53992 RepID=A0AA36H104_CYLNA|nr:unnamed protein product [Cylicocyclus nassatus]
MNSTHPCLNGFRVLLSSQTLFHIERIIAFVNCHAVLYVLLPIFKDRRRAIVRSPLASSTGTPLQKSASIAVPIPYIQHICTVCSTLDQMTSMETTSSDLAVAMKSVTLGPCKDMGRKKLELKLITENTEAENACEDDPPSPCYSSPNDSEPPSPDSGFSSDENASPLAHRDTRRSALPSALRRRPRSKVCAKRVRFADALGLDLEKRKYFTEKESNPFSFPTPPSSPTPEHRLVLTNFVYRTESEYNQRARDNNVCLAKLHTQGRNINGQINVSNIAFTKEVAIRYTTNDWASYDEVAASYGHNVFGANNVDAFVFSLILPTDMKDGQCQFCVRFLAGGQEFWDNNGGDNYRVNMVQESSAPSQSHLRRRSSHPAVYVVGDELKKSRTMRAHASTFLAEEYCRSDFTTLVWRNERNAHDTTSRVVL